MKGYTDADLLATIERGVGIGYVRQAQILLTVPEEVRSALAAEAWTLGNLRAGGRPSDDLREAVAVWRSTGRFPATETAARWRAYHQ